MTTVSTHIFSFVIFVCAPSFVRMQSSYIPLPSSHMIRIPFSIHEGTNGNIQQRFPGTNIRARDFEMQQGVFQPFIITPQQRASQIFQQNAPFLERKENGARTTVSQVSQNSGQYGAQERESLVEHQYQTGFMDQQPQQNILKQGPTVNMIELRERNSSSTQYGSSSGEQQTQRISEHRSSPVIYEEHVQTSAYERPFTKIQQSSLKEPEVTKYGPNFDVWKEHLSIARQTPSFSLQNGHQFSGKDVSSLSGEQTPLGYRLRSTPESGQQPSFLDRNIEPRSEADTSGREVVEDGRDHRSFQYGGQRAFEFGRPEFSKYGPQLDPPSSFLGGPRPQLPTINEQEHQYGGQYSPQNGEQQVSTLGFQGKSRAQEPPPFSGQQFISSQGLQSTRNKGLHILQSTPVGGLQPKGPRFDEQIPFGGSNVPQYRKWLVPTFGFQGGSSAEKSNSFSGWEESPYEREPQTEYRGQKRIPLFDGEAPFGGQLAQQYREQQAPSIFRFQGRSPAQESPLFEQRQGPAIEGLLPQQYGRQQSASMKLQRGSQMYPFDEQHAFGGQRIPHNTDHQISNFGLQSSSRAPEPPTTYGYHSFLGQGTVEYGGLQITSPAFKNASRQQANLFSRRVGAQSPQLYSESHTSPMFRRPTDFFPVKHGLDYGLSNSFQERSRNQELITPFIGQQLPLFGQQKSTSFGFQDDLRPQLRETKAIFQGGSRSQQELFKRQPEPSFGEQKVAKYDEKTPSSMLQRGSNDHEGSGLGTNQGSQFEQPREIVDGTQLMPQSSYDVPRTKKPLLGDSPRKSSWRSPEIEFSEQPKSTFITHYGNGDTPSLEQGERTVSWMRQPQNSQQQLEQHGMQNAVRENEKITLGTNHDYPHDSQSDIVFDARVQPDRLPTGVEEVLQKKSLLSFRSLLQILQQLKSVGNSPLLIQQIVRSTLPNIAILETSAGPYQEQFSSRSPEEQIEVQYQVSELQRQSAREQSREIATPRMQEQSIVQPLREEQIHQSSSDVLQGGQRAVSIDEPKMLEQGQLMRPQTSELDRLHHFDHQLRTVFQHSKQQQRNPMESPVVDKHEALGRELTQQERLRHDQQMQLPRVEKQEQSGEPKPEVPARLGKQTLELAFGARALTQNTETSDQPKPKVRLQVFFESMCPDSHSFIVSQLKPMMDKIGSYVHLELHPYGKAKTDAMTGEITCQHGPNECTGNIIDACGVSRLRSGTEQSHFVSCMFENSNMPLYSRGQYCSEERNLDWNNDVKPCADGPEGSALHHKHGEETMRLQPPTTWVPLVILNNKRGDEEYQKILTNYIFQETCSVLTKMNNRPPGC